MTYKTNPVAAMDLVAEIPKRIAKIGDFTYPEQREIYRKIGRQVTGSTIIAGAGLGAGVPYFLAPLATDIVEKHLLFMQAVRPDLWVDRWDISEGPYKMEFTNVVGVEVIEHCPNLDCIKHLMATGQNVWFSTPNRNNRLISDTGPRNKFHVKEYTPDEILEVCPQAIIRDWQTWGELSPDTTISPLVYECRL